MFNRKAVYYRCYLFVQADHDTVESGMGDGEYDLQRGEVWRELGSLPAQRHILPAGAARVRVIHTDNITNWLLGDRHGRHDKQKQHNTYLKSTLA